MLSYCWKCKKNTESKSPTFVKTKKRRILLLSKCEVCDSKKAKLIKEKETSWLLSTLTINATSIIIFLGSALLFSMYKMNEKVKKNLLACDTFMLERN